MGPATVDFCWPSGGGNSPGDECMEPYFDDSIPRP